MMMKNLNNGRNPEVQIMIQAENFGSNQLAHQYVDEGILHLILLV